MALRRRRLSGLTLLVAVVLLLLPAMAWLQYRWLGQVSDAERDRMQRTLRTAAAQFATAFDTELSRAVVGLQIEGAIAREQNWAAYAQRYTTWTERAADARLIRDVLLVDTETGTRPLNAHQPAARSGHPADVDPAQLRVRRWNNEARTFEPMAWSADIEPLRDALADHFGAVQVLRGQGGVRFRREAAMSFSVADPYTLVSPITHFEFDDDRSTPPRIDVLGFTLIRLDPEYVNGTLLPVLTARHFHGDESAGEYRVAVTDRHDPGKVIWESEPDAARAIGQAPDVEQPFMSARPDQVFMLARGTAASAPPPPLPPAPGAPDERIMVSVLQNRSVPEEVAARSGSVPGRRMFGAFEGRWRVAAVHRAGSLEAAVAAVRARNLMLSSGILLLLTTVIGLIVVSSRRAETLARQQMEFVAAVSHELRTPVSVIGTAASNLADGVVSDPARVRKYGETIQGEAKRLADTVERVLQLAGIAAGSAARDRTAVPVPALVRESLAACRSEIEARGVSVELSLADDLPPVHGDAGALRSALQNLISNAVKYGGDARWVRIAANTSANRRSGTAPQVAITVADRGLGIASEDRKHIFEPFYRGREAVSRQIQGSGLGLNLVARIAEAHGGRVDVSSEPGKGATFTLTLPQIRRRAGAHEGQEGFDALRDDRQMST